MADSISGPQLLLTRAFIDLYPAEAAQVVEGASAEEDARLLETLGTARAADLLGRLSPQVASECIERMNDDAVQRVLCVADPARVAALLACLEPQRSEQRLSMLPRDRRREVEVLMRYPVGTAGHIMDPQVSAFPGRLTVQELLSRLHQLRERRIDTLLVIDGESRLIGSIGLQVAILASPDQTLQSLITPPPRSVAATASQEEVVQALTDYRLGTLPVVDFEGRLVGAIRRTAMLHAIQEEATAGIQTMVGVSREERALSGSLVAVSKRQFWLQVNLLTAALAAFVVWLFEATIAQVTALAVLLPVVAGQSGNTGAQALAVTMRGLALREVRVRHWLRVLRKEATAGLLNGLAVAMIAMAGVYLWKQSAGLSLVIGVSMVASMVIAGVAGTMIPMVLTALGRDPAQSSSIILTTVTDVVGFLSFLGLATIFSNLI